MTTDRVVATPAARRAMARDRQRELYGTPLSILFRRVPDDWEISRARLADTIGISRSMLCQLSSAQRIKIFDPVVLARLMVLDELRHRARSLADRAAVAELLSEVAQVRRPWPDNGHISDDANLRPAIEALRAIAPAGDLAAAAVQLDREFPELAGILRQAATSENG